MSVDPLAAIQGRTTAAFSGSLFLQADADFSSKLTLGQIIKGRVLRSYEGNRYLVRFLGEDKVVDSAVPLKTDEVIYGRVVGLGEKVELERVPVQATPNERTDISTSQPSLFTSKSAQLINTLFEQYQAKLTPQELSILQQQVSRAGNSDLMALSGLVLNKVGVPLAAEVLRSIFNTLLASQKSAAFVTATDAARLQAVGNTSQNTSDTAQQLAVLLQRMLMEQPSKNINTEQQPASMMNLLGGYGLNQEDKTSVGADTTFDERSPNQDLAKWILNAQIGGTIYHRVGTIPIMLGERLLELDVALFEQTKDGESEQSSGIRHRRIAFSINTELLGHVDVKADMANEHMRLSISTDDSDATQQLSMFAGQLSSTLERIGFEVDEISYETRVNDGLHGAMHSVVEHLISPDSVSRLV